jgi:hypothetical protein
MNPRFELEPVAEAEHSNMDVLYKILISNGINHDDSQEILHHIQSDEWEKLNSIQQIGALGSTLQMCNNKMFDGRISAYFKEIVHAAAI